MTTTMPTLTQCSWVKSRLGLCSPRHRQPRLWAGLPRRVDVPEVVSDSKVNLTAELIQHGAPHVIFGNVIFGYNARSTHTKNNLDQRYCESKCFPSKTLKKFGQIINYKLTDNIHTHLPLSLIFEFRVNSAASTALDPKKSACSSIIMCAPLRGGCRKPSPPGAGLGPSGDHPLACALRLRRSLVVRRRRQSLMKQADQVDSSHKEGIRPPWVDLPLASPGADALHLYQHAQSPLSNLRTPKC